MLFDQSSSFRSKSVACCVVQMRPEEKESSSVSRFPRDVSVLLLEWRRGAHDLAPCFPTPSTARTAPPSHGTPPSPSVLGRGEISTMPAAVRRRADASAAASSSQAAEGSHSGGSAQGAESSRAGAAASVPDAQLCRLASIELSGTPSVMGSCVALSPAGQVAFVSPAAIHVLVRRSQSRPAARPH